MEVLAASVPFFLQRKNSSFPSSFFAIQIWKETPRRPGLLGPKNEQPKTRLMLETWLLFGKWSHVKTKVCCVDKNFSIRNSDLKRTRHSILFPRLLFRTKSGGSGRPCKVDERNREKERVTATLKKELQLELREQKARFDSVELEIRREVGALFKTFFNTLST